MTVTKTRQPELLVCAISFFTAAEGGEHYYRKGDRYQADEVGPRIHPDWFLPVSAATSAALSQIDQRQFQRQMTEADAVRERTEAAMRPEPKVAFAEHEYVICIKSVGIETKGGHAPSHLILRGTLLPPDSPWYVGNRSCFRSVLPKGAKPEECLVVTETHGADKVRLYEGEFVRRDDPRVAINPHCFREAGPVPAGGFRTFNTYVAGSTEPPR